MTNEIFPLSTGETRGLPPHDKVVLLRFALRRRFPRLRLGYAPRKRPALHALDDAKGEGRARVVS